MNDLENDLEFLSTCLNCILKDLQNDLQGVCKTSSPFKMVDLHDLHDLHEKTLACVCVSGSVCVYNYLQNIQNDNNNRIYRKGFDLQNDLQNDCKTIAKRYFTLFKTLFYKHINKVVFSPIKCVYNGGINIV